MQKTSPATRFAIAATASILATAALAAAQTDMSGFKAMDANGDGKVTAEEHAGAARKMFEAMDANRDGKVTAAEMDAAQSKVKGANGNGGGMSSPEKIRAVDANGDGILTAEEHAAGSRKMFDAMNTDRDGALSQAEFDAGHAKLLKK